MSIRKLANCINPVTLLTILIAAVLLLAVFGTTSDITNTTLNQQLLRLVIQQNEAQQKLIETQDEVTKQRSVAATAERKFQIEQTLQLKKDLQAHVQELVGKQDDVVNEIANIIKNHTGEVKDSHADMVKILKQPQSNFTAQKQAIANIETVLENQEKILQRLNSSLS